MKPPETPSVSSHPLSGVKSEPKKTPDHAIYQLEAMPYDDIEKELHSDEPRPGKFTGKGNPNANPGSHRNVITLRREIFRTILECPVNQARLQEQCQDPEQRQLLERYATALAYKYDEAGMNTAMLRSALTEARRRDWYAAAANGALGSVPFNCTGYLTSQLLKLTAKGAWPDAGQDPPSYAFIAAFAATVGLCVFGANRLAAMIFDLKASGAFYSVPGKNEVAPSMQAWFKATNVSSLDLVNKVVRSITVPYSTKNALCIPFNMGTGAAQSAGRLSKTGQSASNGAFDMTLGVGAGAKGGVDLYNNAMKDGIDANILLNVNGPKYLSELYQTVCDPSLNTLTRVTNHSLSALGTLGNYIGHVFKQVTPPMLHQSVVNRVTPEHERQPVDCDLIPPTLKPGLPGTVVEFVAIIGYAITLELVNHAVGLRLADKYPEMSEAVKEGIKRLACAAFQMPWYLIIGCLVPG
ncbi:MAG: hypothetical protein EON93_16325, partial [Burkholderiales bacterium]